MDATTKISTSALLAVSLGTTVFQMGCTPPPPALQLEQVNPGVVVKAGQPVDIKYTINSPLAQSKAPFDLPDEFILRTFAYTSDDIQATIYNSSGISTPGAAEYMLDCDFFDIDCWALQHVGTVQVVPIANTTYSFTVKDRSGEFPLAGIDPDNLLATLISVVISTPGAEETYQESIDIVVDPDIAIASIPSISLNPLNRLPSGPLRDCIAATGAQTTAELDSDLVCSGVTNLAGIQFFYNLNSLTIDSTEVLNLRFLEYLTGVGTIDVSATANSCADQTALQAALPGVNVIINAGC